MDDIAKDLIAVFMGRVKWELECANKMVLQADRNLSLGKAYAYERAAEMLADRFQIEKPKI